MVNTKQKILHAAKSLFNETGYSQVTIRMIASSLGISSGNLNYHFPKREDILEALYFEMVETFDRRLEELAGQAISLQYMQVSVVDSMKRMVDYRFFWTDLYNILKANSTIRSHFEKVKKGREEGYRYLLGHFREKDVLQAPGYRGEYSYLIERMIDFGNTWLYASRLYTDRRNSIEFIDESAFQLMAMLFPYLTTRGKKEFAELYGRELSLS